jgi:hypothetical protein
VAAVLARRSTPAGRRDLVRVCVPPPESTLIPKLSTQVLVKEATDLHEDLPAVGCGHVPKIMSVGLALVDLQSCLKPGLTQLAMHADGVAQEEVARFRS